MLFKTFKSILYSRLTQHISRINSKSMFCLYDRDDLQINLTPLRKRNPIKILGSSSEQHNSEFGPSCPILTLPLNQGELRPLVQSKHRVLSRRNLLCWPLYFRTKVGQSQRHHTRLTDSTQRSKPLSDSQRVSNQPEVGSSDPKSGRGPRPHKT